MNRNKSSLAAASALFLIAGGVATLTAPLAIASSHSDAPLIKQDTSANLTDVYAFVGVKYDDPSIQVLNVVANVHPFSEPGDGPHYDRFADDALYSLHITNPLTGETVMRYDFRFSPVDEGYKNPGTILSYGLGTEVGPIMTNGDARQNYTQTYSVSRFIGGNTNALLANNVKVSPPNVGINTTPLYNDDMGRAVSGAMSLDTLDPYTRMAIADTDEGGAVFAGPRDDGFYADTPGIFDLLNVRILDNNGDLGDGLGQDGNGIDGFKGFNVLTFAVQIPLDILPSFDYNDAFFGPQSGVGVYASVSRRNITVRNAGNDVDNFGGWIQVNRLGNPLFNEALVAFADKDHYNAVSPVDDSQFAAYASNPELAALINTVYGTSFVTEDRADLVAVFIPDVLRVSTQTGPVRLPGEAGYSRFGFIGGDTSGGISSGWPNGRRFGDDVVDIALTAIASGPSYDEITLVGDNSPGNDMAYNNVFPYAATPHAGTHNRKDSGLSDFEIADINGDGSIDFFDVSAFLRAFQASSGN